MAPEKQIKPEDYVDAKDYLRDKLENEVRHQKHEKDIMDLQRDRNTMLKNLEELPEAIKGLNASVQQIDRKMFESEYGYENLTGRVKSIEKITESKRNANATIWVAVIGGIALLGGSAITFAEIFFR